MNRYFYLMLCFGISLSLYAQPPTIQWFEAHELKNHPITPLGANGEGVFHLWSVDGSAKVMKDSYTFDNPQFYSIDLPILSQEEEMRLSSIFPLKENIMIVASKGHIANQGYLMPVFNKDLREFKVSSWIMGFDGKINERPLEIFSMEQKYTDTKDKAWALANQDSTMMMFMHMDIEEDDPSAHININVTSTVAYEAGLNFQFDIKYDYSNPDSKHNGSDIEDVAFGRNYVFMMVRHADHPGLKVKEWVEYRELWRIDPISKKIEKLSISEKDHNTGSYRLVADQHDRVGIAAVFYNPKKVYGSEIGTIQARVDGESMKPMSHSFSLFDKEWEKHFKDDEYGSSRKLLFNEHSLIEIREKATVTSGGYSGTQYSFEDLYVIYHSFDTEQTKYYRIAKDQESKGDQGVYSGYQVLDNGETYKIIFNDNEGNFNNVVGGKALGFNAFYKIQKGWTVAVDINKKTGEVSDKSLLWKNEADDMGVCPKQCFKGHDGKIYLVKRDKKTYQYGVVAE